MFNDQNGFCRMKVALKRENLAKEAIQRSSAKGFFLVV